MLAGYPLLFSAILSENEAVIVTASMMYQIIYWGANASYVLEIILLFQFWKQVQDGNARTTPGKAIGFLFIPFYNLYWIFVAYWGLAKELKRYIFAHFGETGEEEIRKPKMFLSMLMSLSPFIYGLLIMAYIILFTVSIATKSPEFFQQDPQKVLISMIYPFMGIGGLLVLLRIAVYSDFYLSVRSILKEN
jgi:hypothetical protein